MAGLWTSLRGQGRRGWPVAETCAIELNISGLEDADGRVVATIFALAIPVTQETHVNLVLK